MRTAFAGSRHEVVRFVALGDSTTVGLGDPLPGGAWRGWAALLADALAPPEAVEFHNIAEAGALTTGVDEQQLPRAIGLRPTVAAIVAGTNDTLRSTFDIGRTARALDHAVGELRASGSIVLTARLPDPGRMLGLPGALSRPLARRIAAVNAVTDAISVRHGTVHFDAAGHPDTYDRRMWSVDRLHPNERGHRFLAAAFADLLVAQGFPIYRSPSMNPTHAPPSRSASLLWMVTKGTKWLYHRSGDLVPSLAAMTVREWWWRRLGLDGRADLRASAEVDRVIAALRAGTKRT